MNSDGIVGEGEFRDVGEGSGVQSSGIWAVRWGAGEAIRSGNAVRGLGLGVKVTVVGVACVVNSGQEGRFDG